MRHSVFGRSLRDQRRSLIGWSAGAAAYVMFVLAVYPVIHHNNDLQRVVESYPEALRKMFAITEMGTPAGYLGAELFSLMVPLFVVVYALLAGGDATAGEEERHTIDLLMANPVTRTSVILQKSLAIGVGALVLGATLVVSVIAVGPLVGMGVPYLHLAAATLATVVLAAVLGAVAVAVGAVSGRRGLARGVAGAVTAAAYALSSLGAMVDGLKPWRVLSPFYHAVGTDPIHNGLGAVHLGVLIVLAAALVAAAAWLFERRDLAS